MKKEHLFPAGLILGLLFGYGTYALTWWIGLPRWLALVGGVLVFIFIFFSLINATFTELDADGNVIEPQAPGTPPEKSPPPN